MTLLPLSFATQGQAKTSSSAAYAVRKLLDHSGKRTSLANAARGKRLVVVVMKGAWCKVCVAQLSRLASEEGRLRDLGARVVGITTDTPKENKATAGKEKIPFSILSDEKHEVLDALGLWRAEWGHPMPSIVVFDRCGAEQGRLLGRRPGQRPEASLFSLLEKLAKKPAACGRKNA